MRVLVTGHGRRAGHARRAAARGARRGERDRRLRHLAAATAPAAQRVPPHRAARPGADHRVRARLRARDRHPLRRLRARLASRRPRGGGGERGVHRARARRRRRRPAASSGSRCAAASRSTAGAGVAPWCRPRTRRSRRPRPTGGRASRSRPWRPRSCGGSASRSPRSGSRPSSARTCPARSGGSCACPWCRSRRWPIPPSSLLSQEDAARAMVEAVMRSVDGPVNVVGRGAASPWQAVRLGGRIPIPVLGPGWDVGAAHRRDRRRAGAAARRRADAPRTGRRRRSGP